MPKTSPALLMFTRNDLDLAGQCIRDLRDYVREVVIVDSSNPAHFREMRDQLDILSAKIYRVVPTGYSDVLHPYGVSRVSAEWTLWLDTDEEASTGLKNRLSSLEGFDAYIVPRWERQLRVYTPQMRLFRTGAYSPGPLTFGHPEIHGTVGHLEKDQFLIHNADFRHYLTERHRRERYMNVESYERPFTGRYAREALTVRLGTRHFHLLGARSAERRLNVCLSRPASRLLLAVETLQCLFFTGSQRLARFQWKYGRARLLFFESLDPADLKLRLDASREIREVGGMSRYLGFDDFAYLERLTESFNWNLDGPEVLDLLLRYRHEQGYPLARFAE